MRPIRLTMKAFGSYAKETSVPFDALGEGLYLITGDTGAGKTTIFDAIVFALFGEASGTGRKKQMLHSDYVSKSEKTVVTLEFAHNGQNCKVERTISFAKKRGTSDQYGDAKSDAQLWEGDKDILKGDTKVTRRMEELLGMNAEQFRKIVMLAQGEFDEFLRADSDAKNQILGKLFDSRPYVRFQTLLKKAALQLSRSREEERERLTYALSTEGHFRLPEGLGEAERALYLPEHPELEANLAALTEGETAQCERAQRENRQCEECLQQTRRTYEEAQRRNSKLDELNRVQSQMSALEGQRAEMDALAQQRQWAERALHQVQPSHEVLRAKEQEAENNQHKLVQLSTDLERQRQHLHQCEVALISCAPQQAEISRIESRIHQLETHLQEYDSLDALFQEEQTARRAALRAAQMAQHAAQESCRCEGALSMITQRLDALEGIDGIAEQKRQAVLSAARQLSDLTGEEGLTQRVSSCLSEEKRCENTRVRLEKQTQKAAAANETHHLLYQSCVRGQAALLARDLREKVEQEGDGVCPVCGSYHQRGTLAELSCLSAEVSTWEQVNRAKDAFDEEERRRIALVEELSRMETQLQASRQSALQQACQCLECDVTWAQLTESGYLDALEALYTQREQDAQADYRQATQSQQERTQLKGEEQHQKSRLTQLTEERQKWEEEAYQQIARGDTCAARLQEKRSHLEYDSRLTAEKAIEQLGGEREHLRRQVEKAQQAERQARTRLNTTEGQLCAAKGQHDTLKEQLTQARITLETALKNAGFADFDRYTEALAPIGTMDGEQWLRTQEKILRSFQDHCIRCEERVTALRQETEGYRYADIEELHLAVTEVQNQLTKAQQTQREAERMLENHLAALQVVRSVKARLSRSAKAAERITRLAELSNATLSFDRYVMGAAFKEILAAANVRLAEMSGGKYELIHQLQGRRSNSAAGLEIEVLDHITGKQRKSDSLSGGESFQVSMSLALGLSDVVQSHAGGRRIEAMFIDEGFGSLDDTVLEKAINVLRQLSRSSRQVGIISHVARLEECIPEKICVSGSRQGSSIRIEH